MTLRRTVAWIVLNAAVVLGVIAWTVARSTVEITGPNATGSGGLVPIGTLLLSVLGALVVANAAWILFVVRKR